MAEEKENVYLYRVLPEAILTFFLDSGLEDIDDIGKKYGMSQSATDELDVIQQDILFGYVSLDAIENVIRQRLGLDSGFTRKVALDLIKERFLPIDSYMGSMAFRTYTNLGGDLASLNVKRIDATGGTVSDIKQVMDREISNILIERAKEKNNPDYKSKKTPDFVPLDTTENVVAPKVAEPLPKVQPKPELIVTPKLQKKPKPAVETVKKFDKKLDKVDLITKGEIRELAPPPPVVVDATLPATKKDVGPMVTDEIVEPVVHKAPLAKPTQKKRLGIKPRSEIVVKPKKFEPKKDAFPNIKAEAQGSLTLKKLKNTGSKAPENLESSRIDQIQRKLTLTFPSQELDKRFRVVLGARLSGVRSFEDFKKALSKDIAKGGLGLDTHTISRVIEEVEGKKVAEEESAMAKHKLEKDKMVKDAQAKYGKTSATQSQDTPKLDSGSVSNPQKSTAKTILSDASVPMQASPSGKKPIEDIKYKRRLVGPIDEFRRMNLDDFRRLPGDIETAQENLMTDINTLGGEDPGLRIRAIEAWRHSPLVELYQRIIGTALQDGLPVDEVLKDKTLNPKGMTKEELNAVRKMNTVLRY